MRCCGSRRNASRVALDASTPDFPFMLKLELEAADTGNEAHDGLKKVDVEIVADNGPVCGGKRRC